MAKAEEVVLEEQEEEYEKWLESVVIADKEGVPLIPELVEDEDEGEDGGEE